MAEGRGRRGDSLYDRHKKPIELDRSKMPAFKKISCQSISDVTVVEVTNNSAHPQKTSPQNMSKFTKSAWQQGPSIVHNIRPVSYESSLPSSNSERGRGRRKRRINPPTHTAKRGRGRGTSTNSVFDSLLESHREKQTATSSADQGWKDSCIIHEIPDSPPPVSGSAEGRGISCSPTHSSHSSASSTTDLTAIQLTCRLQEKKESTLPSLLPNITTHTTHTPSHTSRYWRGKDSTPDPLVQSSDILVSNESQLKGHPSHSGGGVACIAIDTEDDCLITETTSSLFRASHTPSAEVRERDPLPRPDPAVAPSSPVVEEELMKLRKNTANFRNSTRRPAHLSTPSLSSRIPPSPPPSSPPSPSHPSPRNHKLKRTSLLGAVIQFANNVTDYRTHSNHPHSNGTPHKHPPSSPKPKKVCSEDIEIVDMEEPGHTVTSSHSAQPNSITSHPPQTITTILPSPPPLLTHHQPPTTTSIPSSPPPTLTNPELDDDDEDDFLETSKWLKLRREREREREREKEKGSVFDFMEDSPKKYPTKSNSTSFYGASSSASIASYGQRQLLAARTNNTKKPSLPNTLQGMKAPVIKPQKALDFHSNGKNLLSLKNKQADQSSNRPTHHKVGLSLHKTANLSTADEFHVEVGSVRIGILEEIQVVRFMLSREEVSMKLVAKQLGHLKYNFCLGDISEWKMNLKDPPRCIMIKLRLMTANKWVTKLRSQFKLNNQRFLNVESRNRWEWYWVLQIAHDIDPDTMNKVNDFVDRLEHQHTALGVTVDRDMSVDDVKEFLSELNQQTPVTLYSAQPSDVYNSSRTLALPQGDCVRRSSRLQNKSSQKEMQIEKWRDIFEEGEEEEAVMCVAKGDPKKIILTYKPEGTRVYIEISELDLDCLEPSIYLNDRVIDFYLMYLWYDVLGTELRDSVHIFSSFFHQRLMDSSRDAATKGVSTPKRLHDRVKSWTRHVDLFSKDYIILPVCVRSHWLLALICYPGHYKATTPPPRRRRKPHPLPRVLRNTRSQARQEKEQLEKLLSPEVVSSDSATPQSAIDLISLHYTTEEEREEETEMEWESEGGDHAHNIHYSSCEEGILLGEGGREGEGEIQDSEPNQQLSVDMELREGEEGNSREDSTRELSVGDEEREREGSDGDQEEKKPCIMVLDSLEIRRGAIVNRINNYLSEEWEVKKKEALPMTFRLKSVYPKLLPQNNSCDCGVFVLQYVETLFKCIQEGVPPPSMPDDWASYQQTQAKRQQLKTLITKLGTEQGPAQSPPTPSDSPLETPTMSI